MTRCANGARGYRKPGTRRNVVCIEMSHNQEQQLKALIGNQLLKVEDMHNNTVHTEVRLAFTMGAYIL